MGATFRARLGRLNASVFVFDRSSVFLILFCCFEYNAFGKWRNNVEICDVNLVGLCFMDATPLVSRKSCLSSIKKTNTYSVSQKVAP